MRTCKHFILMLTFIVLVLAACDDGSVAPDAIATSSAATAAVTQPTAEATATLASGGNVSADSILISELLVGMPRDNNAEFIELYNPGEQPVTLQDYELVYKLKEDGDEEIVYFWWDSADIPAQGHLLLVRSGADVGLPGDGTFNTPLFDKGGLILYDADGKVIDTVGWGDAPSGFVQGAPAAKPAQGDSLERLPGGADGHTTTGDNSADFVAINPPNPQNSGSAPTPAIANGLIFTFAAAETVEPGDTFTYQLTIANDSGADVTGVTVVAPVDERFAVVSVPDGAAVVDGVLTWPIGDLAAAVNIDGIVELQAPYDYVDVLVRGHYAESAETGRTYGVVQPISVSGGALPIGVVRTLPVPNVVTIEGVATMYTDGFFAGTTGTKFYIEDETGGVQVYVPGGKGGVNVAIGDRVRVTGATEIYRDSLEVVPVDFSTDIEILESAGEIVPVIISAAAADDALVGRLAQVEGVATRIEEFTFSYEIDLTDDEGHTTLVYIEKDTGVTAETLELGERYRVIGISELYDGAHQLKPRIQSDLRQVFPPMLRVTSDAPSSIPGEPFTVTVTAHNHTRDPMTNMIVTAALPQGGLVTRIGDGGTLSADNSAIVWTIEQLPGNDGSAAVAFTVSPIPTSETVSVSAIAATADQWPDPALSAPVLTFIGDGVPVWALQGAGDRSPYVARSVTTEGVVTGVFPELGGFWIQEMASDDDPATSSGMFVLTEDEEAPVKPGDLVRLNGLVREISGQTTLAIAAPVDSAENIAVLSSDNPLPDPVPYDPPLETDAANAYKEALEGMLVVAEGPLVTVAPTTQYGETALVASRWGVDSVRRGAESGLLIFVDDGSSAEHADQASQPFVLAKGDVAADFVGPLAYTFDNYKIEPIKLPSIIESYTTQSALPAIAPLGVDQFSIATFNVENLFDTVDPHPDDPPQPTSAEYEARLRKVADTLVALAAPTVIGLQEVENIGVLEAIAAQPQLAEFGYEAVLIEGDDSRGIDVGYLVRGDQATIESVESFPATEGLTTRHPLLLQVRLTVDDTAQTVYIINNHFLSLSAGEEATEPRRAAQAAWNVAIMNRVLERDPDANFVVLGDLNSFVDTLPLQTLTDAGLVHVYDFFADPDDIPYTYIFEGMTQTLDHILVSPGMFAQLTAVETLPINADYPLPLPDDATPRRSSDHDPLIAIFTVK